MLGEAIGDLLPSAAGVALSPLAVVAVILTLTTPRARSNGPAFAAGWVVGLVVVFVLVLLLAGGADDPDGETRTVVDVLKIGLAVVLLGLAKKNWDKRPTEGEAPRIPSWMEAIQGYSTPRSFVLGAVLGGVSPKNLALTVAAASSVAQVGLSTGGDVVAVACFVVLASLTIAAPVGLYLTMGDKARAALSTVQTWMAANNVTIMMIVCIVLAAKLLGGGISGLSD